MPYQFKESVLGPQFCKGQMNEAKKLIDSTISFTVCGMPGVGVSIFLRLLASQDFAHFIHIDIYKLPQLSKEELFKALLLEMGGKPNPKDSQQVIAECGRRLRDLAHNKTKVVIIFNRFDTLKKEFDRVFFSNLLTLREIDRNKIVCIFTANKPLVDLVPKELGGGYLFMLSKNFYLKPYLPKDLETIAKSMYPGLITDNSLLNKAITLSGGHHQLMQLILKSVRVDNPILDQFVRLQIKEIFECLSYQQKKELQNIARNKPVYQTDPYLLDIGLVKKTTKGYALFTPLFVEYLNQYLPAKLPVKESRLLQLLKRNEGMIVPKDEIFNTLWPGENSDASDWALNSLIYRLRKNPSFKNSGYIIESYKKQGYKCIRS